MERFKIGRRVNFSASLTYDFSCKLAETNATIDLLSAIATDLKKYQISKCIKRHYTQLIHYAVQIIPQVSIRDIFVFTMKLVHYFKGTKQITKLAAVRLH